MAEKFLSGTEFDNSLARDRSMGTIDKIAEDAKDISHCSVYVAVGSAANMKKFNVETGRWSIDKLYQQQFPVFLEHLKTDMPFSPLHIILIDPGLEDPPFMVSNEKQCGSSDWNIDKQLDEGWVVAEGDRNVFHNDVCNIHVYCIREYVTYPGIEDLYGKQDGVQYLDLEFFLDKLNRHSINNNWFSVFYDFSGKDVGVLASFYDAILGDHRSHIIYGLGARTDGGCYIDLVDPVCDFAYIYDEKCIQVYNPFIFNERFDELLRYFNYHCSSSCDKDKICIVAQTKVFLQHKINTLKTNISVLRKVKMMIKNPDIYLDLREFRYINKKYEIDIYKMINDNNCEKLFHILSNIIRIELESFFIFFNGSDYVTDADRIIDYIMSDTDPYSWVAFLSNAIKNRIQDAKLDNLLY